MQTATIKYRPKTAHANLHTIRPWRIMVVEERQHRSSLFPIPPIRYLLQAHDVFCRPQPAHHPDLPARSEEHTSELQSLMRTLYAVFCLKKKTSQTHITLHITLSHITIQH